VEDKQSLECLRRILADANLLAAQDAVTLRVAGERIAVIAADVLYELDFDLPDVTSLLPTFKREQG
jgi:hypothetical protein